MLDMMRRLSVLLLLAALTGCGSSSDDAEKEAGEDMTSGVPACADVWKPGATLPKEYDGCMNGDVIEAAASGDCGFVWYDDRMFAEPGEAIVEGDVNSEAYKSAAAAC